MDDDSAAETPRMETLEAQLARVYVERERLETLQTQQPAAITADFKIALEAQTDRVVLELQRLNTLRAQLSAERRVQLSAANSNARHENNMARVRQEMRLYPDVFDVDADVGGQPVDGLHIGEFGTGKMVMFSNALVLPAGATEYVRSASHVTVWLESFFGDACPRLEVGSGEIRFSFSNFKASFADAVKKVRAQMANSDE